MFGETIDYHLLKPLTHKRNIKTEDELNEMAMQSTFTPAQGSAYLEKIQSYFGHKIPIDPNLSYLDIGCGMGRLTIGLTLAGAKDVTGVDIVERHIAEAKTVAATMDEALRPTFYYKDIHEWETDKKYDIIFVLGAMEHIHSPGQFLKRMATFLAPNGKAFVSHEPFQSPTGDHMQGFFKVLIPWRGLLFSERAVLRLRRECYRPTDQAARYEEIVGGLNKMSYSTYVDHIKAAGLKIAAQHHDPQLWTHSRYAPLRPISASLTSIPKVRDYFIMHTFSILEHAG